MDVRLDGKVALVTGASKGIGRGIAEEFARSGADVTITYDTDEAGAEETAAVVRAAGRKALIHQVDVAEEAAVARLFAAHLAAFGRIDILVNNAGMSIHGNLLDITTEIWDRILRANLYGAFFCMRAAARQMIEQGEGGRIITISSVHEESCNAGGGPYCVSKAGLRNLMRTLAIEVGEHGITVNGIAPGMTVTPMNRTIFTDLDRREKNASQIVLKTAGFPQDIANMAVFLASDAASYCTGSTFFVDGGWMLTRPPV